MAFDSDKFIDDLWLFRNLEDHIKDPRTPEHHRPQYMKEFEPVAARIAAVFALLERAEDMREGLLKIMYDKNVSYFSSDPTESPFHIAYNALGGDSINGRRIDNQETLRRQLKHDYQK